MLSQELFLTAERVGERAQLWAEGAARVFSRAATAAAATAAAFAAATVQVERKQYTPVARKVIFRCETAIHQ